MFSPNLLKIMGIRLATEYAKQNQHPAEKLWKAVVATAFEDVICKLGSKMETYRKKEAHDWFISESKDFQHVCYLAGLEPESVAYRYKLLLNKKIIYFTELQKEWVYYKEEYKSYRSAKTKGERKIILTQIEIIKNRITKKKAGSR
jgi:hypothetical protein